MRFLLSCLLAFSCLTATASAEEPSFIRQVSAHVSARPMRYPQELMRQPLGIEVIVVFSLDHDGKLVNPRISKGSGSAKLDQDTLEWLASLQPFPPVPADMARPGDFTLPVQFKSPAERSLLRSTVYDPVPRNAADEKKLKQIIGSMCRGC
jgi:TonB family protein